MRFKLEFTEPKGVHVATEAPTDAPKPRQIKNRSGCSACKRRRVKCDDAKPVCKRCEKRGDTCERPAGASQWRVSLFQPRQINGRNECLACKRRNELGQRPSPTGVIADALPRLLDSLVAERGINLPGAEWDLLDNWFNHVCRIFINFVGESNPLSFPILETLSRSRAATHAVQSISTASRGNFSPPQKVRSLEERRKALKYLRQEIDTKDYATEAILFTAVILGYSEGWLKDDANDFGLEHLRAANTILSGVFVDGTKKSELFYLSLGMFLAWDSTCSFLASEEKLPIRSPLLAQVASQMDTIMPPNPVIGIAAELLFLIGSVGRLSRRVWDTDISQPPLDRKLELQLLQWRPQAEIAELEEAIAAAHCFQATGLIMLYDLDQTTKRENIMTIQVGTATENSKKIPKASPYHGCQAFVLATVRGEVMDKDARECFVSGFHQLSRRCRLRANYHVLQFVQEVRAERDLRFKISVPQAMCQENYIVTIR